jgi:ribonuclease HIII
VGFSEEEVLPVGSIELLVSAGISSKQPTIMVKFLLVDRPSAYNAIIGRTTLNKLKAVTSTPHLSMKFPTEEEVGEVKGDQWAAQQCYNMTLKRLPKKVSLGEKSKEDAK